MVANLTYLSRIWITAWWDIKALLKIHIARLALRANIRRIRPQDEYEKVHCDYKRFWKLVQVQRGPENEMEPRLKSVSESYHSLSKGNEPASSRYEGHVSIWLRTNRNENGQIHFVFIRDLSGELFGDRNIDESMWLYIVDWIECNTLGYGRIILGIVLLV